MEQVSTFNSIIDEFGLGDDSTCPLSLLLVQSTDNATVPLVLSGGTGQKSIPQGLYFREYDDRATTISRLFPTIFQGYKEVDCNGALNIQLKDSYTKLVVGGVASIDGIVKVVYLSPQYLEYNRYGIGWFYSNQTTPTDTFDITLRHAKAILAAGQTQLDDMEGMESTAGPEPHEILVYFLNPTVTKIGWTTFTPNTNTIAGLREMNKAIKPQQVAQLQTATLSDNFAEVVDLVRGFLERDCRDYKTSPDIK